MNSNTTQHSEEIPLEIEARFEGEWIAWDCETQEVLAHDVDPNKLIAPTNEAHRAGHLIYFHHVLRSDAVLVGGF